MLFRSALYNNHNVLERFDTIDNAVGIDHVVDVMDEAMNQAQHESKLLWWYDLDLLPCVSVPVSGRLNYVKAITYLGSHIARLTLFSVQDSAPVLCSTQCLYSYVNSVGNT